MKSKRLWHLLIFIKAIACAIICATFIPGCSGGEENEMEIGRFFPKEFEGWTKEGDFEIYDYDGIFRYIDGAGEVYRMFDYREVWVAHYVKNAKPDITVEIFDMGKSEDAYGIFMHSTSGGNIGIGQGSVIIGGILYFWKGRYFISLYSEKRSDETDQAVKGIAAKIAESIAGEGKKPEIIEYLPETGETPAEIKYFHLHTSLNYYYYLSDQNLLNLDKNTEAVLARYSPDDTYFVCIGYPTSELAEEAYRNFIGSYIPEAGEDGTYEIDSGKWTGIKEKDQYLLIAFDAVSRDAALAMIESVHNRLP